MNKKHFILYLFFLILIIAFFLRLYHLDERVLHQDEAAVGYITYKLFNDSTYFYDPAFHGPFMYYVTSEMYRHLGDTIYASRLLPAILGALMILLLIPLRRYLGNSGILFAAFFLALSPSFLYYSIGHRLRPPFIPKSLSVDMRIKCLTRINIHDRLKCSLNSIVSKYKSQLIACIFSENSTPS